MLKINLYKILFVLQRENYSIPTMDLANLTKINYKNIYRCLNLLEVKNLVSREIYQDKKKRFILNSLTREGEKFIIPYFYLQFLKNFYES
jgi:DNA-binding MarR family transcriptional regulator